MRPGFSLLDLNITLVPFLHVTVLESNETHHELTSFLYTDDNIFDSAIKPLKNMVY